MADNIPRIQPVDVYVSRIVFRTDVTRVGSLTIPLGVMAELTTDNMRGLGLIARTQLLDHELGAIGRLVRDELTDPFQFLLEDFEWAWQKTDGGHGLYELSGRRSESIFIEPPSKDVHRETGALPVAPMRLLEILRTWRDEPFKLMMAEYVDPVLEAPHLKGYEDVDPLKLAA